MPKKICSWYTSPGSRHPPPALRTGRQITILVLRIATDNGDFSGVAESMHANRQGGWIWEAVLQGVSACSVITNPSRVCVMVVVNARFRTTTNSMFWLSGVKTSRDIGTVFRIWPRNSTLPLAVDAPCPNSVLLLALTTL